MKQKTFRVLPISILFLVMTATPWPADAQDHKGEVFGLGFRQLTHIRARFVQGHGAFIYIAGDNIECETGLLQ